MRWIEQFRMAMLMLFKITTSNRAVEQVELSFHLDQQVKEEHRSRRCPG